jgi:DNA-binding XRE family transcriptional regulator
MASKLSNHLLSYRKRSGLSQDEVAFLLGSLSGTIVCRHERQNRAPDIHTALAYEVIYNCQISGLYPGLYKKIKLRVVERAKILGHRKFFSTTRGLVERKRRTIDAISRDGITYNIKS